MLLYSNTHMCTSLEYPWEAYFRSASATINFLSLILLCMPVSDSCLLDRIQLWRFSINQSNSRRSFSRQPSTESICGRSINNDSNCTIRLKNMPDVHPNLLIPNPTIAVLQSVDKEFSLPANYSKSHGDQFKHWLLTN